MEFELVVVKQISKPKIKNIYRVVVEFMHGDADGTTYATFDFPADRPNSGVEEWEPGLDELLTYLNAFFSLHHNAGIDFTEGGKFKKEVLNKAGLEDDAINRVDEAGMWESDITCEGRQAFPEAVTITYFNDFGVEHSVKAFEKNSNKEVTFKGH
jgi:hypothetical protein